MSTRGSRNSGVFKSVNPSLMSGSFGNKRNTMKPPVPTAKPIPAAKGPKRNSKSNINTKEEPVVSNFNLNTFDSSYISKQHKTTDYSQDVSFTLGKNKPNNWSLNQLQTKL